MGQAALKGVEVHDSQDHQVPSYLCDQDMVDLSSHSFLSHKPKTHLGHKDFKALTLQIKCEIKDQKI